MTHIGAHQIRRLGWAEDVEGLIALLKHEKVQGSARLRRKVCWSLPRSGTKLKRGGAVPALVKLLKDDDKKVRTCAAARLGQTGDRTVVPDLVAGLEDLHRDVRLNAATSLGKIGDPAAVDPLVSVLTDRGWMLRAAAARALGEIGDPSALDSLVTCLATDRDHKVKRDAASALAKIGGEKALDALTRAEEREGFVSRAPIQNALRRLKERAKVTDEE